MVSGKREVTGSGYNGRVEKLKAVPMARYDACSNWLL